MRTVFLKQTLRTNFCTFSVKCYKFLLEVWIPYYDAVFKMGSHKRCIKFQQSNATHISLSYLICPKNVLPYSSGETLVDEMNVTVSRAASTSTQRFHSRCGENISLSDNNTVARRVRKNDGGIVFSEQLPVAPGTVFQVKILEYDDSCYGSIVSV